MGHALQDVGNRHYRAETYSYVARLLPYIEELNEKLENALQDAFCSLGIERKAV